MLQFEGHLARHGNVISRLSNFDGRLFLCHRQIAFHDRFARFREIKQKFLSSRPISPSSIFPATPGCIKHSVEDFLLSHTELEDCCSFGMRSLLCRSQFQQPPIENHLAGWNWTTIYWKVVARGGAGSVRYSGELKGNWHY